jgi:hypothetical protein
MRHEHSLDAVNFMSPASSDWETAATIAVFVLTYAGVALGRAPGLRIDRAGIALVGASLMIGLGSLSTWWLA